MFDIFFPQFRNLFLCFRHVLLPTGLIQKQNNKTLYLFSCNHVKENYTFIRKSNKLHNLTAAYVN